MSDVVAVALISSSFPAAVAVIGAVASIFGPSWRDRSQRAAEAKKERDDQRYERALAFVDAMTEASGFTLESTQGRVAQRARIRFIATLRKGEGPIEPFTNEMRSMDLKSLNHASELLFSWLRGEIDISSMKLPSSGKSS